MPAWTDEIEIAYDFGHLYVLDNRTDKIQPAEAIDDYRPVLSFSGPFAWTYGQTLK